MNILLVEDDPIVTDVLAMTLEDAGYFTIIAGSIHEALEELNINEIFAVLLDLKLPDGDGTRVARLYVPKEKDSLSLFWWFLEIIALMTASWRLVPALMGIYPNHLIKKSFSPI